MHPEDGATPTGLPTITITPAEDTPSAWSTPLPLHTRPGPVPEQLEQQDPDDSSLDAQETTHPDLDNVESGYPPFSAENDNDSDTSLSPEEREAEIRDRMLGPTPDLLAKFDERMDRLEISFALTKAVMCFEQHQDDEAESGILQALDMAKQFGDEATIAQCIYWLARVEFHRGNDANAHRLFLDARPCIGVHDEGQEVPLFLSLYQRGVTEEDRVRILHSHVQAMRGTREQLRTDDAVHADSPNEAHESESSVSAESGPERGNKRKLGNPDIVDQLMRTPHKGTREHTKPKPWIVRHNPDIYPRSGYGNRQPPNPNPQDSNVDMMWLKAARTSSFRPEKGRFTFTM